VDRVEDASASYSSTLHDNDASLLIGANADGSYFDGMIDEVRIATADKSATLGKADVEYEYNARNQLVTETCGLNVRTYSYDNNGNVTKIEGKVDTTVILTEEMAYDKLNRMTRHEGLAGTEVFTYRGAEWHRFSQATAAGGTSFLYDGDNVVADIASGVDAFYVTPLLDQNLSVTKDSATYYYSQDGLGSVRTLTDSTGAVKNTYDYLPFGGALNSGTSVTVEQRYTYTGREKNPESALMYYRYRQYDPRVGRFGGRDPIGYRGGIGLYAYAEGCPISEADPSGLGDTFRYSWSGTNVATFVQNNTQGNTSYYKKGHGVCGDVTVQLTIDANPTNDANLDPPGQSDENFVGVEVHYTFQPNEPAFSTDPRCCCEETKWFQQVQSTTNPEYHWDNEGYQEGQPYGGTQSQYANGGSDMYDYPGAARYDTNSNYKWRFSAETQCKCTKGLNTGTEFAYLYWFFEFKLNKGQSWADSDDTVDMVVFLTGYVWP
jgi:RHS repeat-associated protein